MFHYRVFGGLLRSELPFPELEATAPAQPRWTLRCAPDANLLPDGAHLGTDLVTPDVLVHLYQKGDGGFRLRFGDTGCFDISADGAEITWYRPPDASLSAFRADFTSRVLAAALHAVGILTLHGSAVVMDEVAVGLIAPKRQGKSTLALALVAAGARLLTDDTFPVQCGRTAMAHPGLHAARLWGDSAKRVSLGVARGQGSGGKTLFTSFPEDAVSHACAPLSALYVLAPIDGPGEDRAVWRVPLTSVEGAAVILGNAKLAPLLGKSAAPSLLAAAAALARSVPVYRLNVVRDLDRLEEVAATIRAWHAPASRALPEPVPA